MGFRIVPNNVEGPKYTLKVIVNDRNTTLMNPVAKVFPTSHILFCRYHITKYVRSILKLPIGTKQIKGEYGKMFKASVILESIMGAWNVIINSSTKELYVDSYTLQEGV